MKKFTILLTLLFSTWLSAQCFEKVIAGEQHFLAISQDGALWGWGENGSRQLGDGSTINRDEPVLINSDSWLIVSAGLTHSMGIKSDGTLWAWGSDNYEKLGNGSSGNAAFPQQIGVENNWKEVVAGERGTMAIKNDGTLWGWGSNNNGYLGNNESNSYEVDHPVQIGMDTDWVHISGADGRHCLAIKGNGTLWSWGWNSHGQLGDGTMDDKYLPAQIGDSNDWKWIDSGSRLSFAMKTDNTIWGWGFCNTGFTIDSTYPLQIGTDSDWKTVSFKKHEGSQYMLMIKTNGTLWGWGNDNREQLGNGADGNYGAPTQIGDQSDWKNATAGYFQSNGIKEDGTFWTWGDTELVGDGSDYISSPEQYNCTPLSVKDYINEVKIKFYPNPAKNKITISGSSVTKAMVYDVSGKKINLNINNNEINVSELILGTYILILETDKGIFKEKLIKK